MAEKHSRIQERAKSALLFGIFNVINISLTNDLNYYENPSV